MFDDFGSALRAARLIRRMTQRQLADETRISIATVRRHESGDDVKSGQIERYSTALQGRFVFGRGDDGAPAVGFEPTTYRLPAADDAA